MQSSVNISSEVLDWVIAHAQMNSLSPQIVGYLNLWVSGEKKPTFWNIEILKKETGVPYINILNNNKYDILLSISHEKDKAIAFVVIK